MTRQEQHELAKKIKAHMTKCKALRDKYMKMSPLLAKERDNNVTRLAKFYLDTSGTPEADAKNIAFLESMLTVEGRQHFFERFIADARSADPALFYSGDVDGILSAAQQNPALFYGLYENKHLVDGMKNDLALSPEGKAALDEVRFLWQQGGNANALIELAANDLYLTAPIEEMGTQEGIAFCNKHPEQAGTNLMNAMVISGFFRDNKAKYDQALSPLRQQGILSTDIYRYRFLNENGQSIPIGNAINDLAAGKRVTWREKTEDEMQATDAALKHPFLYGHGKARHSETPLPYNGVTGLGLTSTSNRGMEKVGGSGTFYGGLQITPAIRDRIAAQPIAQFLYFTPQDDGSFRMNYKLPETGKSADGRTFQIRQSLNVLSKYYTAQMFNRRGQLDLHHFHTFFDKMDDALTEIRGSDNPAQAAENALNMLKLPEGPSRQLLRNYLLSDEDNARIAQAMCAQIYGTAASVANYHHLEQKENPTSEETQLLFNNYAGYQHTLLRLQQIRDMDPHVQMEPLVHLECNASAGFHRMFLPQVNRTLPENRQVSLTELSVSFHQEGAADPHSTRAFVSHHLVYAENVELDDGQKVTLALETTAPPAGTMFFDGEHQHALGIYRSPQEITDAHQTDYMRYIFDVNKYQALMNDNISQMSADDLIDMPPRKNPQPLTLSELKEKESRLGHLPEEYRNIHLALSLLNDSDAGTVRQNRLDMLEKETAAYLEQTAVEYPVTPLREFIGQVHTFASAQLHEMALAYPGGIPTATEKLQHLRTAADGYFRRTQQLSRESRLTLQENVTAMIDQPCHKVLAPQKLSSLDETEQFIYLDRNSNALGAMTILANHAEDLIEDMRSAHFPGFSNRLAGEMRLKGALYAPLLEQAQLLCNDAGYRRAHGWAPISDPRDQHLTAQAQRCQRFLDALPMTRQLAGENYIENFVAADGQPITVAQVSRQIINGTPLFLRKADHPLECYRITEDGAPDLRSTYIDPAALQKHGAPDYKTLCTQLYQSLKSTDQSYVWSNSQKFADLRDALKAMANPKRNLTPEQQKEAFARLETLSTAYLNYKAPEMSGPTPKTRSIARVIAARRIKAYATALKDPAAYMARAHAPQRGAAEAAEPKAPQKL